MKPRTYAISVFAFTLGVFGVPALAQNDAGTPSISNDSPQNAPIPQVLTLTPPKNGDGIIRLKQTRYQPGQPIQIAFTINNTTKKSVGYDYPTAEQFDVTVSDAQGHQVWDWAQGRQFAPRIVHLTLKPGQPKTYRVVWNGRNSHGQPVAPGVYTINARMTSSNRPAITGNLVVNTDTDPQNMGVPTRTPAENGVDREVFTKPPITASKTVAIGVPAPKSQ